ALVVLGGMLWVGWVLLGAHGFQHQKNLSSSTFFDLLRLAFAVVAGVGGVVALVIAYRKQKLTEGAELREATKLHTDRFTAATAQLFADSPGLKLAGVHALAGLADDAPTASLRQTCIDVLCAFLRMPYDPDPGESPDDSVPERAREHAAAVHAYRSLREVRHTVIRVIGAHLRDGAEVSWQGHDFDFTTTVFDGGDLQGAVFTADPDHGLHGRVSFQSTVFSDGEVSFRGTTFSGGTVDFRSATFSGGTVAFGFATFSGGTVDFRGATFSGATVSFWSATFSGSTVDFGSATFSGGTVDFSYATFSGGTVDFRGAFSGGTVAFRGATFSGGTVAFEFARFSGGTVAFSHATFSGGTVAFSHATFSGGTVAFSYATFSGSTVAFSYATLSGGTVAFRSATGGIPGGLLDTLGIPRPGITNIPPEWLPGSARPQA
ncbi:MAG TPA: pentapeptide repeat-containing protein, partial [Trebonia sp.]